MKNVLLLDGPDAGRTVEVHGIMRAVAASSGGGTYNVVPLCHHSVVHYFGVIDGADPLAVLIAGFKP